MLIIWLKVRGFLELEKFGESANPCATERVNTLILMNFSKRKDYSNHVRRLTLGFDEGEELSEDESDNEMEVEKGKVTKERFYAKQV